LTVIFGRSSKGKSALFRAIRGLFRNELAAEHIRQGTEELQLTAVVDGKTVTGSRDAKGTKYQIGDKKFAKLGGNIPDELLAFGMNQVKIGEYAFDPIFSGQFNTPFLIDSETTGPTKLNAILGAFASTEKLEAGKKAANLSITHKNSEAKALAVEITEAEQRKINIAAFVVEADQVLPVIRQLEAEVTVIDLQVQWLHEAVRRERVAQPLRQILDRLHLPEIQAITRVAELVAEAQIYAVQATNNFRLIRLYNKTRLAIDEAAYSAEQSSTVKLYRAMLQDVICYGPGVQVAKSTGESLSVSLIAIDCGFNEAKRLRDSIILVDSAAETVLGLAGLGIAASEADTVIDDLQAQIQELQAAVAAAQVICPKCGEGFIPNARPGNY
jgi:hypothetical protein